MNSTISHIVSHNASALTILHNQVHSEVFNEENAVITESTTKEGVKHRVTSSIGNSAASVSLSTFTVLG
jgi:hypothetical protein